MSKETMKLALDALQKIYIAPEHEEYIRVWWPACEQAITALREALAEQPACEHEWLRGGCLKCGQSIEQPAQQEPVAWLITDEKINSLQVDSIQRLIDRARHAHMTDIKLRINGQDEWYQADWLKHLIRATPPQRTWVGLTDEEITDIWAEASPYYHEDDFARAIEAKLKEKNT